MSFIPDGFVINFLAGFVTNLWVGGSSLLLGLLCGGLLAVVRLAGGIAGKSAAGLTALFRAVPTFVAMFVLLNLLPKSVSIGGATLSVPNAAFVVLSLGIYATSNVSDNLLEALRHWLADRKPAALLFLPNTLRVFFVLVMASSTGAAIGVPEAVTATLRAADQMPDMSSRAMLVGSVLLVFAVAMQMVDLLVKAITRAMIPGSVSGRGGGGRGSLFGVLDGQGMLRFLNRFGWFGAIAILLTGLAAYLTPMPPKSITIATGPATGSWYEIANRYKKIIEAKGIHVNILPMDQTAGVVASLEDADSQADVGFLMNPVEPGAGDNIRSLGAIEYQPLFVLQRIAPGETASIGRLRGSKIALPPLDSATVTTAVPILQALGVTAENAWFSFAPFGDQVRRLLSGEVDALVVMLRADNAVIKALALHEDIAIVPFPQATAVSQQFQQLTQVVLPAGIYDLARQVPPRDVPLVAATSFVVVKESIHPAVVWLLMEAMAKVHRSAALLSKDGEFPALRASSVVLDDRALEYYTSGTPWIFRNLPLGMASVILDYIIFLVPLAVLLPVYRWFGFPDVPDLLLWIRAKLWHHSLQRLADQHDKGGGLTQSHLATLALLRSAITRPDTGAKARELLARLEAKVKNSEEAARQQGDLKQRGPSASMG